MAPRVLDSSGHVLSCRCCLMPESGVPRGQDGHAKAPRCPAWDRAHAWELQGTAGPAGKQHWQADRCGQGDASLPLPGMAQVSVFPQYLCLAQPILGSRPEMVTGKLTARPSPGLSRRKASTSKGLVGGLFQGPQLTPPILSLPLWPHRCLHTLNRGTWACAHTHTCTHAHTYMHAYAHTHAHTCICTSGPLPRAEH